MEEFKDRLRIAMNKQRINASQLSLKTGLTRSQISSYLKGEYKAKQDAIYKLAIVLEVSPAWLMAMDKDDLLTERKDEIKKRIDKLTDTQLNQLEKVMDAMFDCN